ncbi:MAG TPA: phosphatase PAP2 family protein [Mycobacteriales bacterium]|nr:phosphatase PAP2 family protein [Mycobacteriales bacterium]
MSRPARLSPVRDLLLAATFAAALCVVTYLVVVRTRLGQRFDNAALLGSLEQNPGARLKDILFLGRISALSFALVLLAITAIGFVRRRRLLGIVVALAALLCAVGTDTIKNHVLTRPYLVATDSLQAHNTFPSGHTAIAIGCAFALVVLSPPALRGLVAFLAGAYSWTVAADVQTAGWHRPSDAIGAVLLCFAVICVAAALLFRARPVSEGATTTHLPAYVMLAIVWCGSLGVAVYNAVRVLHVLDHTADTATLDHALLTHAYAFSVNLTVAIVVTALVALLLLLGRYDLDAGPSAAVAATTPD